MRLQIHPSHPTERCDPLPLPYGIQYKSGGLVCPLWARVAVETRWCSMEDLLPL